MRLPEGLPELRGRWLAGYKVLWWIMLGLALLGTTLGQWEGNRWGRNVDLATYGAGVRLDLTTRPYSISPFSPAAQAAGIQAGSELLAVNGQPVEAGRDRAAILRTSAALAGAHGQRLVLKLRAPDGSVADHAVVRGPHHLAAADRTAPMSYSNRILFYTALNIVSSLVMIAGAILLFRRRVSDPVVALLAMGLLALPAGGAAELLSDPQWFDAFSRTTGTIGAVCLMIGMSVFPEGQFRPRWTLFIIPLLLIVFAVAQFDNLPRGVGSAMTFAVLASVLTALAVRYRALPAGQQRQQIKWALLGFALFVALFISSTILDLLDQRVESNAAHLSMLIASRLMQPLAIVILVTGLLISLLRHRLYDADAAISRSALYGGMTLFLVAVFAAFGKLFETLGEKYFGDTAGTAAGAIAAGVAALLLVPLHNRLSRWSENRFQRDIAAMRSALPELLAELRDSENPRDLADDALRLAIRGVRAQHGAILLAEGGRVVLAEALGIGAEQAEAAVPGLPAAPEPGLERAADEAFPLRLPLITPSGALTGWLLLGPHPDGSLYGKDDREALEEIASPLARALSLAMERARRAEARRAETAGLREMMDTVAQRLAEIAERIGPARRGPGKPQTIN